MKNPDREYTMIHDSEGVAVLVGDMVQVGVPQAVQWLHGDYAIYEVQKAPGAYRLAYRYSQKGKVMQEGFTSMFLPDAAFADQVDGLTRLCSSVPVKSNAILVIDPQPDNKRNWHPHLADPSTRAPIAAHPYHEEDPEQEPVTIGGNTK